MKKSMKKSLALMGIGTTLVFSGSINAESELQVFEDTKYHWARDYASHLSNNGMMSGYGDGNFGINDDMTREQVSAVISRRLGGPQEEVSHNFKDVGGWSENSIAHLVSLGILRGTNASGDMFEPTKPISRAEFAVIMDRYIRISENKSHISTHANISFEDIDGHWAKESILKMANKGLVSGDENGNFNPNRDITRGEVAAVIGRMDGVIAETPERPKYEVIQNESIIAEFDSKDAAIAEAYKWNGSIVRFDDEEIWNYLDNVPTNPEGVTPAPTPTGQYYDNPDAVVMMREWWRTRNNSGDFYGSMSGGNRLGKTYPDGWTAPKIQSKWTENHKQNQYIMHWELGFDAPHPVDIREFLDDERDSVNFSGTWGGVQNVPDALTVRSTAPDLFEVVITIGRWEREGVETSYRTPIVYREVLKFYFGDNSEEALNVLSEAPDKGFYQIGNRPVGYDGASRIYLGYPNQDMEEFKDGVQNFFVD